MARFNKKHKLWMKVLKMIMLLLFTSGFVYQTLQFLLLYWTYPTVVDIQQSSPTYVEIPAFTFCNRLGYRFENICRVFGESNCASSIFLPMAAEIICKAYPAICQNGTIPKDFQLIHYSRFMEGTTLTKDDFPKLIVPLEEYLTCTIEYAGNVSHCNMDNVMGSFFTSDELPQFCYTLYSNWGQPYKKTELIPRGATMKLSLFLNFSGRAEDENYGWLPSLYNPPYDPAAQIAVHSPYFLPSPYFAGSSFLGGRAYELRIKLNERHLLPYPYQTNCTDYMSTWKSRHGKAPINQLSTIQECRINVTRDKLGCIPVNMDYPHSYNICKSCSPNDEQCPWTEPPNNCSMLGDSYNQACQSLTYTVNKEDKAIVIIQRPKSLFAGKSEGLRVILPMHDCEGKKIWRPECSTIQIDVPFDQFEITNMTYNPKFESLELFSVIGGYMGMWLGISLLTVYDILIDGGVFLRSYLSKRNKSTIKKLTNATEKNTKFMQDNTVYKYH